MSDKLTLENQLDEAGASIQQPSGEVLTAVNKVQAQIGGTSAVDRNEQLNERLQALVVNPVNALPEDQRTLRGKVLTGENVARAIPDVAAFLAEVDLQKDDGILLEPFELNLAAPFQLVVKDDCPEAYGLGENNLEAQIRQTRFVYKEENGKVCVMTGEQFFTVTKRDEEGRPIEMTPSEATDSLTPDMIFMVRGLPSLQRHQERQEEHIGEYAHMNNEGQLDNNTWTWTDDPLLDGTSRAQCAHWGKFLSFGFVDSIVRDSSHRYPILGSRGVLRVKLNLED